MVLRLSRSIGQPRDIPVGYDVVFTFNPFTYAQYKEARAAAQKLSRDRMSLESRMAMEALDDEDMPEAVESEIQGCFEHVLLLLLIQRFCNGWRGVLRDDQAGDVPAPLEVPWVDAFLNAYPGVSEILARKLLMPFQMVGQEGNAFAPSPSGVSAAD